MQEDIIALIHELHTVHSAVLDAEDEVQYVLTTQDLPKGHPDGHCPADIDRAKASLRSARQHLHAVQTRLRERLEPMTYHLICSSAHQAMH